MVVVDNARKLIGKNVDIAVTSVLQTTAGKMIFGKYDERQRPVERADLKPESGKHDLRKSQPIIVEPAPHTPE
jgi:FlaG/FlaF family flagellin (archaellin)